MEQEVASIIAMAQRAAGDIGYYYWNLPESFRYPALYFPQPEISTGGDTFHSYASKYAWYIKVFARTTEEAHSIALSILSALKGARNYVPLIDAEGKATGEKLRLKDPSLKGLDEGVEQIMIEWTSRRPYDDPQPPKVQVSHILFSKEEDSTNGEKDENRRPN